MTDMTGKVAVITGGTSGIGLATALQFANNGAQVAIAGRNVERGENALAELKANGADAIFVPTDVSKASDVENLIKTVISTFGHLDYAFNNAAAPPASSSMGPLISLTEEQWDTTLDVNLKGIWLAMKNEIPVMVENGGGVIINTSSTAGGRAFPGMSAYVASKHGLHGLTKTAALEYAEAGIRINVVMPGPIATPMMEQVGAIVPDVEATFAAQTAVKRVGQAEEIAEAVVWLCSDAASYITGAAIPVDGGMLEL